MNEEPEKQNEGGHGNQESLESTTRKDGLTHQPQDAGAYSQKSKDRLAPRFYRWIKTHYQQWKDLRTHEKLNLWFTFVIAFSTLVYAGVAIGQLHSMNDNNEATWKTLELNFGTEISITAVLYQLEPREKSMVNIQFHTNRGLDDRVAKNIVVSASIDFLSDAPNPKEVATNAPVRDFHIPCSIPGKNACTHGGIYRELPIDGYTDYVKGSKKLYVWGHGTYTGAISAGEFIFCKYTTVEKTDPAVHAIIHGTPEVTKAPPADIWADCP
jgi:hypothetical protein